jgi:diguanylate cyclase (GGDEF)-like protein
MRTPSGKLIVEFAEDEIAFLNALNAILPAVPDFRRAVRKAVGEATQIIPFDAFAVARPGRTGPIVTIFTVGPISSPVLAAVRADIERTCAHEPLPAGTPGETEVEVVELPGVGRAQDAQAIGSAHVHAVQEVPACCCGIFAAATKAFERKHAILLSVLATWLRSYLAFSEAYRQMEEMSFTDPLTGCYNRRKFLEEAEREIERARRYGYDLCLSIVDVDGLKLVNDTFGHPAGDTVLRLVTEGFTRRLRKVDVFARFGGDEFITLLPHTPISGAVLALARVLGSCRDLAAERGPAGIKFSASIGVTAYRDGDTVDTLVKRADSALYIAKRERRGTVVVAD